MGGLKVASWINRNVSSAKDDVTHIANEVNKQVNITLKDLKNVSKLGLKDISLNNIKAYASNYGKQYYGVTQKVFNDPKLDEAKAYVATAIVASVTGGAVIIPPEKIMKLENASRQLTDRAMGIIPQNRQEAINYANALVAEARRQNIVLDPEIYEMANGNVATQLNPLLVTILVAAAITSAWAIYKITKK